MSGVNSYIGNNITDSKNCADDMKILCRCRQVWTGPKVMHNTILLNLADEISGKTEKSKRRNVKNIVMK